MAPVISYSLLSPLPLPERAADVFVVRELGSNFSFLFYLSQLPEFCQH